MKNKAKQDLLGKRENSSEDVSAEEKTVDVSEIQEVTFEELYLTEEEREKRKRKLEKDRENAEYYRKVFENPEEFFEMDTCVPDEEDTE